MNKIKNTLFMALLVFLGVLSLIVFLCIIGIVLSFVIGAVREFIVGETIGKIKMILIIVALVTIYWHEVNVS